MIAGITHLTMEADLERGIELGSGWGFELDFSDHVELPVAFESVESQDSVLPLAVLTAKEGIRLEVVRHRTPSGHPGAYCGIFRCAPPDVRAEIVDHATVRAALRAARILEDPICVRLDEPAGEAWFEAGTAGAGLAGILCRVEDVLAEATFWKAFAKAAWDSVGEDVAVGRTVSPIPGTRCSLVVARADPAPAPHAMNDCGFPSIGVYSTAIDADYERALSAGAKARSGPIATEVGGRSALMALVETPGGTPVELLSMPKNGVR